MDAVDAISPELVLVCPELRTVAADRPPAVGHPIVSSAPAPPARLSAALAAALPDAPLAVGVVAGIAYVVSAFTQ
jgi:hypothetical protein